MKRVVRFTASWCAPCKGLAMQLASVETDVPIEVVDIDEQMDRAAAAAVRSVPTMVMYDGDTEIKRVSGVLSSDKIDEWLHG